VPFEMRYSSEWKRDFTGFCKTVNGVCHLASRAAGASFLPIQSGSAASGINVLEAGSGRSVMDAHPAACFPECSELGIRILLDNINVSSA
jgi:hypothetical protein